MRTRTFGAAAAFACCAVPAVAQVEADHRGIVIGDEDTNLTIGGRLHFDLATIDSDVTAFQDDARIRRLRVDATLSIDDWRFKADADIGGQSTGIRNLWASYRGIERVTIKAGNFIAPVAGENMMSSNNIKLMERSLAATLAPDFLLGAGVTYRGEKVSLAAGYFGDPIEQNPQRPTDSGESFAGRVVWAPVKRRKEVLHFAAGVELRDLSSNSLSRVAVRPEFGLNGRRLVDTGSLQGVENFRNFNLEAAYMKGPFLAKANYIGRDNDAPTLGDPTFSGGSVELAYVLTGERQRYSLGSGTFGQIRPRGKAGAVELAARYSFVDLNSGTVAGGEQQNWSVGVNWYVSRSARIMVNFVNAQSDPGRNGLRENVSAFMTRFQIAF